MTIPDIRQALNELHERISVLEKQAVAYREDAEELRNQIGVPPCPRPAPVGEYPAGQTATQPQGYQSLGNTLGTSRY